MGEIVKEVFESNLWKSATARSGIARVEQERMNSRMSRYLRIARGVEDSGLKPSYFEVAFGLGRSSSSDSISKAEPFILETSAGPVEVSGRIDRIDCAENQAYIVDYKSSQPVAKKEIVEGRSLQLTLYALALEAALMPESVCDEAVFMQPGTGRIRKGMERNKKDGWEERLDTARTVIGEAVTAMRGGRFHPTTNDKSCAYCPKAHVCRYERSRMERKGA
jgi:CRISPR/Cas system-associated exonuclease Cas4 (RecB family)